MSIIQKIIKDNDMLVGAGIQQEAIYNAATYLLFNAKHSSEVRVLLDRNILTRLVNIAKGRNIKPDDSQYKLVSAAMAFFIFCEAIIEPSMAIYEYGFLRDHFQAIDDLAYFRIADHIHPQRYADIALGRAVFIEEKELNIAKRYLKNFPKTKEENFSKQLSIWELNYLFALKIAHLKKSTLSPEQQIEAYFKWMEEETLFNAVASLFATIFLCPNPPEKKMIKGIGSNDNLQLLCGIKNAAWDITYISHWGKSVKISPPTTTWLLCSHDKAMKRIAKTLFVPDEHNEEVSLMNFVSEYWDERRASTVVNTIIKHLTAAKENESERNKILSERFMRFPRMIKDLENDLGGTDA
jgi:hypothetical protein